MIAGNKWVKCRTTHAHARSHRSSRVFIDLSKNFGRYSSFRQFAEW